jgi:enamine deaminase RidA (YjgF/YER057c/UK114 family)
MPSTIQRIIQPDGWRPPKGYANAILATGATLHIAGQIGWNREQIFERHDFIGQMEQALANIVEIVAAAGGTTADIVRLTWYVTDKSDYLSNQQAVGEAYRRVMGRHFPAMTMLVVKALVEDEALVEIEATAVLTTSIALSVQAKPKGV